MVDVPDSVTSDLREEAGDALRVVATYDRDGYHLVYCRDDVTDRVADRAAAIHDDLVLQGIGRDHLESLFEAGELHCSVHRLDELTAFHFLASEYTGLFVSIDVRKTTPSSSAAHQNAPRSEDADADVRLASFADACREHVDTE